MGQKSEIDVIERKLEAHGEAFLRMFDGSEDEVEARQGSAPANDKDVVEAQTTDQKPTPSGKALEDPLEDLDFRSRTSSHQRTTTSNDKSGSTGMSLKKQRRVIMSGKLLHEQHASSKAPVPQDHRRTDHERDNTKQDFEKMRKEVDTLGASALGKRQRKDFENSMLRSVNARVQKSPRIPASIGQGLAKKRKQREEAAKEYAIEAGMLQRKGLGKKRKHAEKAQKGKLKQKRRS